MKVLKRFYCECSCTWTFHRPNSKTKQNPTFFPCFLKFTVGALLKYVQHKNVSFGNVLQVTLPQEMWSVARLAALAFPMGLLLTRTMAWISSGKTHPQLISRLRGNNCGGMQGMTSCLTQTLLTLYTFHIPIHVELMVCLVHLHDRARCYP